MIFTKNQISEIKRFYDDNGFVVVKNFFLKNKIKVIKNNLLSSVVKKTNEDFYFEKIKNKKKIRRVEKITNYSKQIYELTHSKKLYKLLMNIKKNKQTLFKDKLNFKYPSGQGFLPHFDGHFYWKDKNNKINKGWKMYSNNFTNIAISLEDSSIENGCLYVANYKDTLKLGKNWTTITKKLIYNTPNIKNKDLKKFNFFPFQIGAGDLLIFDWLCAHYSKKNLTNKSRMILYLTYCNSKIKNVRSKYYYDKKYSSNSIGYKSCIYNN